MNTSFTPLVAIWAFLALVVVFLAGYRKIVSAGEAEMLHLSDPAESMNQVAIAHKLDVIDKWGKVLTVIAVTYGLLLAIGYTYETWLLAKNLGIW